MQLTFKFEFKFIVLFKLLCHRQRTDANWQSTNDPCSMTFLVVKLRCWTIEQSGAEQCFQFAPKSSNQWQSPIKNESTLVPVNHPRLFIKQPWIRSTQRQPATTDIPHSY